VTPESYAGKVVVGDPGASVDPSAGGGGALPVELPPSSVGAGDDIASATVPVPVSIGDPLDSPLPPV
jgi:hypothetical protein